MYYLLLLASLLPTTSMACVPDMSAIEYSQSDKILFAIAPFINFLFFGLIIVCAYYFYKYMQLLRRVWGKINRRDRLTAVSNLALLLVLLFWFLIGKTFLRSALVPFYLENCHGVEPSIWFTLIDYSVNLLALLSLVVFIFSAQKLKKLV